MITILTGNVLDTLPTLPSNSVQCCVTSPPYWGLRSYLPDGHADKGFELGSEATPQEYVANMVRVFAEVKRVLRDDGTLWLNLGDSYVGGGGFYASAPSSGHSLSGRYGNSGALKRGGIQPTATLKPKDLCGIPWRVAFALQEDGWWLRSEITWCKKAPMPESVTDRPTSATEKIFLLTKSAKYFYDAEAVKEASVDPESFSGRRPRNPDAFTQSDVSGKAATRGGFAKLDGQIYATRNQRNFWLLGPEPYAEAHFATFPTEIPRRAILAGTSAHGACPSCGAPWQRVVETSGEWRAQHEREGKHNGEVYRRNPGGGIKGPNTHRETTERGWQPSCTCGCTDTVPCVVLDPFTGSGTTGAVARTLGRDFIGCELNESYVALARRRIEAAQPPLFGI